MPPQARQIPHHLFACALALSDCWLAWDSPWLPGSVHHKLSRPPAQRRGHHAPFLSATCHRLLVPLAAGGRPRHQGPDHLHRRGHEALERASLPFCVLVWEKATGCALRHSGARLGSTTLARPSPLPILAARPPFALCRRLRLRSAAPLSRCWWRTAMPCCPGEVAGARGLPRCHSLQCRPCQRAVWHSLTCCTLTPPSTACLAVVCPLQQASHDPQALSW